MWFWKKEEPKDEFKSDLSIRVAEIRSRIAALRSSLERPERSNKNTAPSSKLPQASRVHTPDTSRHNERAAKEQELMALKAKLLGKKQ
jgi:uncharacterized small protein (DUF1192 family)